MRYFVTILFFEEIYEQDIVTISLECTGGYHCMSSGLSVSCELSIFSLQPLLLILHV
jgi:hypothetical protein